MKNNLESQAEALSVRSYTDVVFRDRTTTDGYMYVAYTLELEGCMVQGETVEEAQESLRLFRIDYIQHLLEHQLPVPDPQSTTSYNQIFRVKTHYDTSVSSDLEKAHLSVENDNIEYV